MKRSRASRAAAGRDDGLSHQLLSRDEEVELAVMMEAGSFEARDAMISANMRLVVSVADSYRNRGVEFEDLVQEGYLGLIRGVEGFDPSRGYRLSTYARQWIEQSIRRSIINHRSNVRLPAYFVNVLGRVNQLVREHADSGAGRPATEEILAVLPERLRNLHTVARAIVVIDAPRDKGSSDEGAMDTLSVLPDACPSPQDMAQVSEQVRLLGKAMTEDLTARERRVIELRFGLLGFDPLTLREVGALDEFRKSGEQIRQIEEDALLKLIFALRDPEEP